METKNTLPIKADDEVMKGRYTNFMAVASTSEEFMMDFLFVSMNPPSGQVIARLVTSPGHMKRIIEALQTQMKVYEDAHGKVSAATSPDAPMGFR